MRQPGSMPTSNLYALELSSKEDIDGDMTAFNKMVRVLEKERKDRPPKKAQVDQLRGRE